MPIELRCCRGCHFGAKDRHQKRTRSPMEGARMTNLLTILFIIGGLLLLWFNVQDWYLSQVIISDDEHAAVAEWSD